MAAALTRHHVAQAGLAWNVDSAGLYAMPGQPLARFAADALIRRQVVVSSHRSKPVTTGLLRRADLILTMTMSHKADLLNQYPNMASKIYTLREFVEGDGHCDDVVDPVGGSAEVYEACAKALDDATRKLIEKLKSRPNSDW